ncbi:hypothetical protein BSPWISOXPB_8674 [uncultured Gammaproteobacteria bacterium]|nr:hypothetical protein BSPWISOXPB_8674 [uncultured Gammaproteobacteria bacterium]
MEGRGDKSGRHTDPLWIHTPNYYKIEDDPGTIQDESRLAAKYPNNTTVVHMDKNGNYKVVHGLKLNKIPKRRY